MNRNVLSIIIAGFVTVFIHFGIRYSYGILLPEMLPALRITKAEAGIIYASYFIAYTVFSPVLGLLSDRYNAKLILTLFPALLSLGTFLMAFSSSLLNASLFFALVGLGSAACWSPVVALILRWTSNKRKGTALGITDMGSSSGILICSWGMPYIVETFDWRVGWISLGAIALLVTIINAVLVRSYPSDESGLEQQLESKKIDESVGTTYLRLLKNGKFWWIALSYLFVGFSILIPFTFLPIHSIQTLGVSYQTSKWLIVIIAATGLAGKLTFGHLSDRIDRIKVLMIGDILIVIGILGMVFSNNFFLLILSSAVFGFGNGALWPVYAAIASDYFPRIFSGRIIGLWTFYMGVGSVISPPLVGWTIDTTESFSWAFTLGTLSIIMSMLLLLPLLKVPTHTKNNF